MAGDIEGEGKGRRWWVGGGGREEVRAHVELAFGFLRNRFFVDEKNWQS